MNMPSDQRKIWQQLEQIVRHDQLCRSGTTDDITGGLLIGWDATRSKLRVDPPENGIWRAPHPLVLHDINVSDTGLAPILHPPMSEAEIEAGIWRQLRIFPDGGEWRREGVGGDAPSDPFGPDVDLVDQQTRNLIIRSLLMATPRDAAQYLKAKLSSPDPTIGRLLLAKDFRAALKSDPDLWSEDWPAGVRRRYQAAQYPLRIAPFRFLVALACLSRLAQNVCAQIALGRHEDGKPLLVANFHYDVLAISGDGAAPRIRKLSECSLLQTTALLPPHTVLQHGDAQLGVRWSTAVSQLITDLAVELKEEVFSPLRRAASRDAAKFIRDGLMAHPALRPKNSSQSHAYRNADYVTFGGLSAKLHSMVGALQIRKWIDKEFSVSSNNPGLKSGPVRNAEGSSLPKSAGEGRPFSAHQAAAALYYLWLETSCPGALPVELKSITRHRTDCDESNGTASDSVDNLIGGERTTNCNKSDRTVSDCADSLIGKRSTEDEEGLGIVPDCVDDLIGGERFGENLAREVRKLLPSLDRPGQHGFSRWYYPHLYISDDGDDLSAFRNFQSRALNRGQDKAWTSLPLTDQDMSRIDPAVLGSLGLGKGMSRVRAARRRPHAPASFTNDPKAALFAQRAAMMVSASALDQMWRTNR